MKPEKPLLFREWHMDRKYAYFLLAISILSEQLGTACLEASKGYTVLSFSVLTVILYTITYVIFCKILSEIDLAVAYASWSAIGSVGASLMGIFLFHQSMSLVGWISIIVMCIGVFLLNCYGTPPEGPDDAELSDPKEEVAS